MKRMIFCAAFLIAASFAFSQADFSSVDFVEFSPSKKNSAYLIGGEYQGVSAKRYVMPFSLNRYETTYELWHKVRVWAEENGYAFANPGQEGSRGLRAKEPSQRGKYEPVTNICWYDAVVWCNAFSEMEGRTPCYTYGGEVLKDSQNTAACDLATCDWSADGYRLPTETEWEYAARKTKKRLQSGELASGQINSAGDDDPDLPVSELGWTSDCADGTRTVGTAGTPFDAESMPQPGSGNANGSGLFDMSGNVLEFCWDWHAEYKEIPRNSRCVGPKFGSERILRGGSWHEYTMFYGASDRYSFDPNEAYNYMGFRIASSARR